MQTNDFQTISKILKSISYKLNYISPASSEEIITAYRDLLRCVSLFRDNAVKIFKYKSNLSELNNNSDLNNPLDIHINKTDYSSYFVYEITVPIIIPKAKEQINKDLWITSFKAALTEFDYNYVKTLERISNPIVIFENVFSKRKNNGLKDCDNYSISELLNIIQSFFIYDDRTATVIIRNIYNSSTENKTKIIIISDDNFLDYLLNNF